MPMRDPKVHVLRTRCGDDLFLAKSNFSPLTGECGPPVLAGCCLDLDRMV